MNCAASNYCTIMIKLIYVFDKILIDGFNPDITKKQLQEIITDALSSIDIEDLCCPACGFKDVLWKYIRTKSRFFLWDNPYEFFLFDMPEYTYTCLQCGASGYESLSTDITIDKTKLSYHYLFRALQDEHKSQRYRRDHDMQYHRWESRDKRSLKEWNLRFKKDARAMLSINPGFDDEAFLSETMKPGKLFHQFYVKEGRFFLHTSDVDMIIFRDSDGKTHCIGKKFINMCHLV